MSEYRIEKDSLGEIAVPADALYGAQTQRAVENFPISGLAMPRAFIRAVALIKSAVGTAAQIKAAGGVRDLQTVIEMIRLGVQRFGIGLAAGTKILEECAAAPGGAVDV